MSLGEKTKKKNVKKYVPGTKERRWVVKALSEMERKFKGTNESKKKKKVTVITIAVVEEKEVSLVKIAEIKNKSPKKVRKAETSQSTAKKDKERKPDQEAPQESGRKEKEQETHVATETTVEAESLAVLSEIAREAVESMSVEEDEPVQEVEEKIHARAVEVITEETTTVGRTDADKEEATKAVSIEQNTPAVTQ